MTTSNFIPGGVPHNSFDVDADGNYLYLAVKNPTTPQILKMKADLSADATVVFNPGSGTEVNLMTGELSPYWVWATGAFAGTDKVILTQDGGTYWYSKNPASWSGPARPILVGPGNDLLVTTSTGIILQQSYLLDDAIYWVADASLHFPLWAIDRIDDNIDELTVGDYWYTGLTETVSYTPNEGTEFSDITMTLPNDVTITTLIMGRTD